LLVAALDVEHGVEEQRPQLCVPPPEIGEKMWKRLLKMLNSSSADVEPVGCQLVYFQTKKTNLGKFCRVLQWKKLVYFMAVWSMYFTAIWYI
jgi:hypothetical protein